MESTAVVKAFALLETVAAAPQGLALGELAAQAGLNKPTAHRLLKTLTGLGYVEKSGFGQYRRTAHLRRLVGNDDDQRLIAAAAKPIERLHRQTSETVNLGVLRSDRVVYLQVLESTQPLRRVATPNSVDPFYCTALGRAIVAFLPKPQRDLLLKSGPWEPRTAHTVVDPRRLRTELDKVARQGYAIEVDQTDLGVACLGAPVRQHGIPVGAISVSVPTARFNAAAEKKLIAAVQRAVASIERKLV